MILRAATTVTLALTLVSSVGADVTTNNNLDKYQVIIDKSPFRKFAAPNAAPAAQSSVGSLMLVGRYGGGAGEPSKVWIRDTKTGKTYFVGEGESLPEFKIEKIDAENESVQLLAGTDRQLLKFPEKIAAAVPMPATPTGPVRPAYRGPLRPAQQAAVAAPGTPLNPLPPTTPTQPGAVAPGTSGAVPTAPPANTLRRRILRQTAPPPAAETPAAEEHAEAEAPAEEQPAQ